MRLKSKAFELHLELLDDNFVRTPRDSQRRLLLQRAVGELACDLEALNRTACSMVRAGDRPAISEEWETGPAHYSDTELLIDGQQVMQAWEQPLMEALAGAAAESHGDVLEVGFGMGISATFLQERGIRSHTIIECNRDVQRRFEEWRRQYPAADIRMIESKWQDWDAPESAFDSVLFDTYPTTEEEMLEAIEGGPIFAARFFPTAVRVLKRGGVFTYYSDEIDSLSREHQGLLLRHFRSFSVSVVRGLRPPQDCQYWWADTMALVQAVK
jgi:SAM-dependent methyltransferase